MDCAVRKVWSRLVANLEHRTVAISQRAPRLGETLSTGSANGGCSFANACTARPQIAIGLRCQGADSRSPKSTQYAWVTAMMSQLGHAGPCGRPPLSRHRLVLGGRARLARSFGRQVRRRGGTCGTPCVNLKPYSYLNLSAFTYDASMVGLKYHLKCPLLAASTLRSRRFSGKFCTFTKN